MVFENRSQLAGRLYHPIAQLVRNGWSNDEALIDNALIWRAKSLGADGVILLPPSGGEYQFVPFGPSGHQYNFRAEAFIWTGNKPTSPSSWARPAMEN
jgi:hypothetical protein